MVLRPQRNPASQEEFVDPLNRFDPPAYGDDLEQSLCEDPVTAIQSTPFRAITPDTTIEQALKIMLDGDMSCLMVVDGDHLVGMFTERDVLNKVAERFEQVKTYPVSLVMTHEPALVYQTDVPAKALNLMAVLGFRHVPIVDMNEKVVGIIGPRRTIAYLKKFLTEG